MSGFRNGFTYKSPYIVRLLQYTHCIPSGNNTTTSDLWQHETRTFVGRSYAEIVRSQKGTLQANELGRNCDWHIRGDGRRRNETGALAHVARNFALERRSWFRDWLLVLLLLSPLLQSCDILQPYNCTFVRHPHGIIHWQETGIDWCVRWIITTGWRVCRNLQIHRLKRHFFFV